MNRTWDAAFRRYGAWMMVGVLALLSTTVRAETLLATGTSLSSGRQSWTSDLEIASPGTLTVQVSDLGVPFTIVDRLASLSFSVSSGADVLLSHLGEGLVFLQVTDPGIYSLNISATPATRYNLGLVSWSAFYSPAAPVPLPASVWMLIGGIAWAVGLQRRRRGRNQSVTCPA